MDHARHRRPSRGIQLTRNFAELLRLRRPKSAPRTRSTRNGEVCSSHEFVGVVGCQSRIPTRNPATFFFWVFEEDSIFFNLGMIGARGGERRAVLGRHKRERREARASPEPCAVKAERRRVDGRATATTWGSPTRRSQARGRAVRGHYVFFSHYVWNKCFTPSVSVRPL